MWEYKKCPCSFGEIRGGTGTVGKTLGQKSLGQKKVWAESVGNFGPKTGCWKVKVPEDSKNTGTEKAAVRGLVGFLGGWPGRKEIARWLKMVLQRELLVGTKTCTSWYYLKARAGSWIGRHDVQKSKKQRRERNNEASEASDTRKTRGAGFSGDLHTAISCTRCLRKEMMTTGF